MKITSVSTASLATFALSRSPHLFKWNMDKKLTTSCKANESLTGTRLPLDIPRSRSRLCSMPSAISSTNGPEAIISMSLLALQFGIQPTLVRRFMPKSINRSTVVFVQDIIKFFLAGTALLLTGSWSNAVSGWNIETCCVIAGIPSVLYTIQNVATLVAYQNLSPLTFNVLNQTKTLSAALCCYLLMGKVQSKPQILSLLLLFCSACVIEKMIPIQKLFIRKKMNYPDNHSRRDEHLVTEEKEEKETSLVSKDNHTQGVIGVLMASFISGLAGAYTQRFLQQGVGGTGAGRNSYLFTMELCLVSLFVMGVSMLKSQDGRDIREKGFFHNWTPQTLIPITTNALGGIIVGLVTKYAGSVKKGFALIFGLLVSGVLQSFTEEDKTVSFEQVVGGILASLSLWMYAAFPS
jgi:solute carrier family 35 (UDP-sugar transporter), member A1/2/3